MWDLPGPGIEPVSPALAGGLFTTEPPVKLRAVILNGEVGEGSLGGAIWAKPEGGEKLAMRRSGERVQNTELMSKSKKTLTAIKGIFREEREA